MENTILSFDDLKNALTDAFECLKDEDGYSDEFLQKVDTALDFALMSMTFTKELFNNAPKKLDNEEFGMLARDNCMSAATALALGNMVKPYGVDLHEILFGNEETEEPKEEVDLGSLLGSLFNEF